VRQRERHEQSQPLGIQASRRVSGERAPVVADEHGALAAAEHLDQRERVASERVAVEWTFGGNLARMIAAQERRDGAVARACELGDGAVPRVRGVGEAVQQQHERAGSLLEVGEAKPVGADGLLDHCFFDAGGGEGVAPPEPCWGGCCCC
jgi:hypothetical protein